MELSILNLLLVLLSAWIAGSVVARLGYPAIFGELLAGIVLGPPLLGLLEASDTLAVLAEVGVLLMMLYIGMEIDPKELFKASWGGFLAAIGGFITPFALAYIVVVVLFDGTSTAGLFVGIAAGVTSLATKSRILADLNLLDTRIAHVMMAGALVADSLSLIVFAGIISVVDLGTVEISQLITIGVEVIVFFGLAIFLGLRVFPIAWEWLAKLGLTSRTFYATFLLLITLLFAEMAEIAGLHAILGAFLAGLFIREGVGVERRLAGELTELVRDVSIGFLAPIFFVTAGFQVDLNVFSTSLPLLISVTVVATLGKIFGTTAFYLLSGNGWREGIVIGAGMNGRGAVEIIIAEIALTAGIITQEIFSVLVFMAIFTTATVPIFLKVGADWLQRRGELTRSADQRKGVVIVGTGPSARAIARVLHPVYPVWLIDKNLDRVQQAKEEGLNAFYGDALSLENLQEISLANARWFLALTHNT
ncbi:MAG: cation:proton antiporter, partial [Aggregatilineales bacterium]